MVARGWRVEGIGGGGCCLVDAESVLQDENPYGGG